MTPQQALKLLYEIAGLVPLTRAEALKVDEAAKVLLAAITKDEGKTEDNKPVE